MPHAPRPIDGDGRTADDHRLVDAIRAGSEPAFFTLFQTHYDVLCRYVYRYVRSRAIAEELVSDVFLRVWIQRQRWEVRGCVRAYLYGAARNLAIDHLRRARVEQRSVEARGNDPRTGASWYEVEADDRLAAEELAAAMQRVVDALPPRPRQVFLLRWQRHLTNAQISTALGIAVKTVEMHMTRALEALRAALPAELRPR